MTMLAGPLNLFNGRPAHGTVAESLLFTPDDSPGRKLPGLVADVSRHPNDSEETATQRPGLNRTPGVNSFTKQRDEDGRRFREIAPYNVEPRSQAFGNTLEIVMPGRLPKVPDHLRKEKSADLIVGGSGLEK